MLILQKLWNLFILAVTTSNDPCSQGRSQQLLGSLANSPTNITTNNMNGKTIAAWVINVAN